MQPSSVIWFHTIFKFSFKYLCNLVSQSYLNWFHTVLHLGFQQLRLSLFYHLCNLSQSLHLNEAWVPPSLLHLFSVSIVVVPLHCMGACSAWMQFCVPRTKVVSLLVVGAAGTWVRRFLWHQVWLGACEPVFSVTQRCHSQFGEDKGDQLAGHNDRDEGQFKAIYARTIEQMGKRNRRLTMTHIMGLQKNKHDNTP